MAVVQPKKWYTSSTLWINIAGVVAVALQFVLQSNLVPDADVIAIIVAVLNILNRFRAPKVVQPIDKSLL